jgi:hypothetical protein
MRILIDVEGVIVEERTLNIRVGFLWSNLAKRRPVRCIVTIFQGVIHPW